MKGFKCGQIPPCYGGKKFRIHEELEKIKAWDETHDKVYELNKQMCDIGKTMSDPMKPLSEEAIQEIAKALEITRNPKDIMKEKKTKKMTKAEAFEWLKGTKVSVSCREISEKVQLKLFACGVQWKNGGTDFCDYGNYYVINSHGLLGHCEGMGAYWDCLINEEISVDDILSIEIFEEKKDDERKGEILDEIAKLGEKISDLIGEYDGDIIIEIDEYKVLLRNSGDILYRK